MANPQKIAKKHIKFAPKNMRFMIDFQKYKFVNQSQNPAPNAFGVRGCQYSLRKMTGETLVPLKQLKLGAFQGEGFGEAGDAAIAAFNDVLVHGRVVGHGIVAVVTGQAERIFWKAGGGDHAILRKIIEGIGVEVFADFLEGMVGGHKLAAIGKINAIDAGVHVGRATDEHMDFFGAGFLEVVDAGLAGGAADDGIIHNDDALALDQLGDEVELHADVEIADELRGLEEAAADIVVADKGHLEGDAGLEGIAEGGAVAAVGHGDDDVGLDGKFAGELAAHVHADFIDVAVGDVAVRAGEIDVFKDAEGAALLFGKGLEALKALLVDDDNLAWLDVADKFGVDQVERAGFAGKDVGIAEFAYAEGAETEGVARANQFLFRHEDEGIGAFQFAQAVDERVLAAVGVRLGEQVQDDLAVHGGLENGAASFEFVAQAGGIGEVAVVGDGDLAAGAIHSEGLGVFELGGAGGGIAGVADGHVAHEIVQNFAVKNLRNEAHAAMGAELAAVAGDDAGAFLAAVLKGIEAVISEFGGIGMTKNAKDTTVMFGINLHRAYGLSFAEKTGARNWNKELKVQKRQKFAPDAFKFAGRPAGRRIRWSKRHERAAEQKGFYMKQILQVIAAVCLLITALAAQAADLTVFAAASLTDSLKEMGADYAQETGQKVVFNFEASSMLARQIQEGAPADIFFSADETQMDRLADKGLIDPATRRDRLGNTLVVVVPANSGLQIQSGADLAGDSVKQIALGDPKAVPAGVYAKAWLTKLKLWDAVAPKVVPMENVRAALAAVASGNVDAGVVYKTDAAISHSVKVAYEVPRAEGPDIRYPMAVVKSSAEPEAAKKFLDYLDSDAAAVIFKRYGFSIHDP